MITTEIKVYDGPLIHERFAYKYFRKNVTAIGNILAFRAPMNVTGKDMIDLEDQLEGDYIYSQDAMNFVWEIPNLCPYGAVAFQRLFVTSVANILNKYIKAPIELKGDDIIVHKEHNQGGIVQSKGKASVSITHVKNHAAIGHLGINIVAGDKAPAFAYSTNLTDEQAKAFMEEVITCFYNMSDDIFVATTKVLS